MRALIIVDVQNDFCEGGALPVAGGTAVAQAISDLLSRPHGYDYVVATRDHHIDPGSHFSDEPDYLDSWPRHCVAGSTGAAFPAQLDTTSIEAVFEKGEYAAAYSGFEGFADGRSLAQWLTERGVDEVDIAGLATDYCVRASAEDAVRAGFQTRVLTDLTAGIAPDTVAAALHAMREAGVQLAAAG